MGDLRYALRGLVRNRGFSALVLAGITVGVGVNTTIFSVVNGLLFRPLPYGEPDELVYLDESSPERGSLGISPADFLDWRARSESFDGTAAFYDTFYELAGAGYAARVSAAAITPDLFSVLEVEPMLGRRFVSSDLQGNSVVILGHALWSDLFGSDPSIIGETVRLNGRAHTVIGVMPPGMKFPEYASLWTPLRLTPYAAPRDRRFLSGVARLRDGVTVDQAVVELRMIAERLAQAHPETNGNVRATVESLHTALRGDSAGVALLLQLIAALVLATACANVSNLLLARAVARRRAMATRAAVGASRARIVRQLFVEGLVLSIVGGSLGLLLGLWGRDLLTAAIPIELPFWISFALDWRVLAFVILIAFASVLAFTLAPAVRMSRLDLSALLNAGGGRHTAGIRHGRLQDAFVAGQITLALTLLVVGGSMVAGLVRVRSADPGFDPDGVVTARLALPEARYPDDGSRWAFWNRLVGRLSALPEVQSAAIVHDLPLTNSNSWMRIAIAGRTFGSDDRQPFAAMNIASVGYFQALSIPVLAGRSFDEHDLRESAAVAVVNRAFAERFFPEDADPIGERVRAASDSTGRWLTIVGVVGDVRNAGLAEPAWPILYQTYAQAPASVGRLVVKARAASAVGPVIRDHVAALDPDLPVDRIRTMRDVMNRSLWLPRLFGWLATVFAAMGVLLAVNGVLGVIAYRARQRSREMAIRTAFGATPRGIIGLFTRIAGGWSAFALLTGIPAAVLLTRLLSGVFPGLITVDWSMLLAVAAFVVLMTFLAVLGPALMVARSDPMTVLRAE